MPLNPPVTPGPTAGGTHRPGSDGGGGNRPPPTKPPVAVAPGTSVVPHGDRRSFDVRHTNPDGSRTVISHTTLPDGTQRFIGFKQSENPRDGSTTRSYSDGRRVVEGHDFVRSRVGGVEFLARRDGLREATLRDGKPAFKDRFASVRERDGSEHRIIERTRYVHWANGRYEREQRPIVRRYGVGLIHGAAVAEYVPAPLAPAAYHGFHSRFLAPVLAAAVVGTVAVVAFNSAGSSADPATSGYTDPAALMGDMQISSGFAEGYASAAPEDMDPVFAQPDAAMVRSEMAMVMQQVDRSVQGNAALGSQLQGVDLQGASKQLQQKPAYKPAPVQISEDVRQQVRKQVRLSVAMRQNGRPLLLSDVLTSGFAKVYLFQTAQPLNVTDLAGGECFLNTGDLIGFSTLPAADSDVAEMQVVASGPNSCLAGVVVQTRLVDLQEMLNGFSERVEDNMRRVAACSAAGRC